MPVRKPPQPEGTLTLEQAARRLGVTMSDVYRAVVEDELPHLRHERQVLVAEEDALAWGRKGPQVGRRIPR